MMKKSLKKIVAAVLTCTMLLCFASCSASHIEALDLAAEFNKVSETYQIDPSRFTEVEMSDGMRRNYTFRSDNTAVGSFIFTAYLADNSNYVDHISLTLPVDGNSLSDILFGNNSEKEPLSAERKASFQELFIALTRAYTGASNSEAADRFTDLGLDGDAIYTEEATTQKTYGNYTYTFNVGHITTVLQISNDKLYTPDTTASSESTAA